MVDERSSSKDELAELFSVVYVHHTDDVVVIRVEHDLDFLSSPALESAIRLAASDTAPNRGVVVSLEDCRFCDAAGLTVLVRAKKLLGSRFSVVAPPESPAGRILKIAELVRPLSVYASLRDATNAISVAVGPGRILDFRLFPIAE